VESVGADDPAGTWIPVSGKDPDEVTLPVKPMTLITGVHDGKSGTLKVRLTVTVLLSHGNDDD